MPVEQIERVSRYAGGENPHLSRLGGGEWQRTKTRVRKAVTRPGQGAARALLGARARAHGRPFGDDTPWQQEMEAAFPYEETPDQLRADRRGQGRPGARTADGPPGGRRRRLRQDRGRDAGRVQGDPGRHAGRRPRADDGPRRAAPRDVPPAVRGLPVHGPDAVALRRARSSRRTSLAGLAGGIGRPGHRHAPAAVARTSSSATWAWSSSTRSSASASPTRSGSSRCAPRSTC